LILEAIITSENDDGTIHVAPMGPHVSDDLSEWTLKPFQTSTTFRNLYAKNRCVVNIVDDALLLAQAVVGQANESHARYVDEVGYVLNAACHWYGLTITSWDVTQPRAIAKCSIGSKRVSHPFFGWNRAKHSVLELAILVSRLKMLEKSFIQSEIERLRVLIDKTAGERESIAFDLLVDHINRQENVS